MGTSGNSRRPPSRSDTGHSAARGAGATEEEKEDPQIRTRAADNSGSGSSRSLSSRGGTAVKNDTADVLRNGQEAVKQAVVNWKKSTIVPDEETSKQHTVNTAVPNSRQHTVYGG